MNPSFFSNGQRRMWSDWADTLADLSRLVTNSCIFGFLMSRLMLLFCETTVKPVCNIAILKRSKIGFNINNRIMQVNSIAECPMGSILQYFRPSLSYDLSLKSLFCLFWVAVYTGFTVKICDPSIYTLGHPDLTVPNFMEKSTELKRVKTKIITKNFFEQF